MRVGRTWQRDRQTGKQKDRQTNKKTDRHKWRCAPFWETDRKMVKHTADRPTDSQTDRYKVSSTSVKHYKQSHKPGVMCEDAVWRGSDAWPSVLSPMTSTHWLGKNPTWKHPKSAFSHQYPKSLHGTNALSSTQVMRIQKLISTRTLWWQITNFSALLLFKQRYVWESVWRDYILKLAQCALPRIKI